MASDGSLEIVSATRHGTRSILVDFSDGTSAYFSATQLGRLATNRMKTGYWPEHKVPKQHLRDRIVRGFPTQRGF